jgi:transcriptional regulator with XRE-family HTH domain
MSSKSKATGDKLQVALEKLRKTETYDKETIRDEISELIHQIMLREEVKPAELARRLEKSRAYVTKILQGNANFTIDSIVKIARALGYNFVPTFVPKETAWQAGDVVHLTAKASRVAPATTSDNEDYVTVHLNTEEDGDEGSANELAS